MVVISAACGQNLPDRDAADKAFSMMNQVRVAAGLAPLKADPRINDAATLHVIEFAKEETPANQYGDEPWLMERLRMAEVRAGAAGEILSKIPDLDHLPDQLKTSETTQKVLLNPKFSSAGVAAMRSGSWLYVVGDLVQPLESLSDREVEALVVDTVQHRRAAMKILPFKIVRMPLLHSLACEMVKKDSLKVAPIDPYAGAIGSPSRDVRALTFTAVDPRNLSDSVQGPASDPKLNALSVGVCYGSTRTYPTGTYWVAMEFYNSTRD